MKAFNLPIDYVLYEMSYANVILYGAVLPCCEGKRKDKGGKGSEEQDVIRVDDPANREAARAALDSFD